MNSGFTNPLSFFFFLWYDFYFPWCQFLCLLIFKDFDFDKIFLKSNKHKKSLQGN
jgi:hypothetical protein